MKRVNLVLCAMAFVAAGCTHEKSEGPDFTQLNQAIEMSSSYSPKVSPFVRTMCSTLTIESQKEAPNWTQYDHESLAVRAAGELEVVVESAQVVGSDQTTALESLGGDVVEVQEDPGVVRAWLPYQAVESVAALSWVTAIKEPPPVVAEQATGNVIISEGVGTHNVAAAQTAGITGTGEIIGVISIASPNIATAQANGELPPFCPVTVAGDCQFGQAGATPCICTNTPTLNQGACTDATNNSCDEGTAMLEIVTDMAPGANLIFASTQGSTYANTLDAVVAAGATIVTEDLAFDTDPAFQQGTNAARADFHANNGISIHASAGNLGANHAAQVLAQGTGNTPDNVVFAAGGPANCAGIVPNNTVAIAPGNDTTFDVQWGNNPSLTLQWSEPRNVAPTAGAGGFTDLQILVMDQALTQCLIPPIDGVQANGVGDTLERVVDPPVGSPCGAGTQCIAAGTNVKIVVNVAGTSAATAVPTIDLRLRGVTLVDGGNRAGSLNPDSNFTSGLVNAVASTSNGLAVNAGSSSGPFQIGSTTACAPGCATGCGPAGSLSSIGTPVTPECQNNTVAGALTAFAAPAWTARDGTSISGVGQFGVTPGGAECGAGGVAATGQCFFFGTSAAAPHSAGCAALVGQVLGAGRTVAGINQRLSGTATGLGAVANVQGAGLLDCFEALDPPEAVCQPATVDADASCNGSVVVDDIDAGSNDTQGPLSSRTLDNEGPFGLGTTPVTLTVTDSDNLPDSCATTVTVEDNTAPQFLQAALPAVSRGGCKADGEVVVLSAPSAVDNCSVVVTGAITASDNTDFQGLLPLAVDPVTGEVTLPIGTHTVTWTATDGVQQDTITQEIVVSPGLGASQELLVRHGTQVLASDGSPGSIVSSGVSETRVESGSLVGTILSIGNIKVDGSTVDGDARSAGEVSVINGGEITGDPVNGASLNLPAAPTLNVTFPPAMPGEVVNDYLQLPPGSYESVIVNSNTSDPPTLVLSSGDYFFGDFLTVNTDSRVVIDDSAGPVRIFVENRFDYRSSFAHEDGTLADVFIGFLGAHTVLEADFQGSFIAPNGIVELGNSGATDFRGQFFARVLILRDNITVQCLADAELDLGAEAPHCSDGSVSGDETDTDCGGSCPACPDGSSCGVDDDCMGQFCQVGTCSTATCTDGFVNQDESDTDCGGACGSTCVLGEACNEPSDCVSLNCTADVCGENAFSASLSVFTDWGWGYCATIVTVNDAPVVTSGWDVIIDLDGSSIYTSWNAAFSGNSGEVVVSLSASSDLQTGPGASDSSVGFCANRDVPFGGTLPSVVSASGNY